MSAGQNDDVPDCGPDCGPYKYSIKLGVDLTAEKLVKSFGDSAPDDVRTLVQELDDEVGLWALTILLARYFEAQMVLARIHCPELVEKSDSELINELKDHE